jgi:hypothetical protein
MRTYSKNKLKKGKEWAFQSTANPTTAKKKKKVFYVRGWSKHRLTLTLLFHIT